MNSVPTLHTDRCTLTAVTQSDIPVLRQILDDSETQRFLPELCEEFQTTESLQQFVASFDKLLLQDEGILWGIRKDNVFIGFIAIMDIKTIPSLFYAMHSVNRRSGYMKESLKRVLGFVSGKYLCSKLQTEVYHGNTASLELLFSIGFHQSKRDKQKEFVEIFFSQKNSQHSIHLRHQLSIV